MVEKLTDKELEIAYQVIRSKNKRKVFRLIKNKPNFMQSDFLKELKNRSHISRAFSELEELGLIKCNTPDNTNYKLYSVTPLVAKIREEVEKYDNPNRD